MKTEISRIEMVLLALIARKPRHAYEIDQFITSAHMRRWVRIGAASVYQGLGRLEEKELAVSRREQEGRMPPRKCYSITSKGRKALAAKTRELLSASEDYFLDLNLGLFCADSLADNEVPSLLKQRVESTRTRHREIENHARKVKSEGIWQQDAVLRVLLTVCRSEEDVLKNLATKLKNREGTSP